MYKYLKKSPLLFSVFWGFVATIPFATLEYITRYNFKEEFATKVFTFMWVLQTLFILLISPVIRSLKSDKPLSKKPIVLILQISGAFLIAYIWAGWVLDQWPCFIGVPNCD